MAMPWHKAGASRSFSATDGSDISPQHTPPAPGSLEMPHLVGGDRQSSMPAADLSNLDDRVARLVVLKMAEMSFPPNPTGAVIKKRKPDFRVMTTPTVSGRIMMFPLIRWPQTLTLHSNRRPGNAKTNIGMLSALRGMCT